MVSVCNEETMHSERVKSALAAMPNNEEIEIIGQRFKALSEPSRIKILFALQAGELCVDHIVEAVGGNQSAVSHQLKTLKDNKIVKSRRDGKKILYAVSDGHVAAMLLLAKEDRKSVV